LGSTNGASSLTLNSGTGAINMGTSIAKTITIGNTTGATALIERVGTGNYSLDGVGASTYTIGASTTTGTISIGGTAQTGSITIGGTGANTGNIDIGTGTGAQTINIGTGAASKTLNIGTPFGIAQVNISSGTSGVNVNVSNNQPTNINTGGSTGTTNINTGTSTGVVSIGNSTGKVGVNVTAPNVQLDVNGGFALRQTAVSLTGDNQAVTVSDVSYLEVTSNNATATNRTMVLGAGSQVGQLLFIVNVDGDANDSFEIQDGGNVSTPGGATVTFNDNFDNALFMWTSSNVWVLISSNTGW
ncbi:MAG: hypothetical protein WBM13_00065, partial [Bacteroidia bacterium]